MSLDKVIENILETGKREAQQIAEQGKKEKQDRIQKAEDEGQKILQSKTGESEKLVQRMNTQEMARAELESKKIVLSSQKEILDSVYETALRRLSDLPQNETLLRTLVSNHKTEISAGMVYCNQKDEAFVKGLVGSNFGGATDCIGGLVIESQDGTTRIDLRYETMLQEIWDDSIKDIADLLWGE